MPVPLPAPRTLNRRNIRLASPWIPHSAQRRSGQVLFRSRPRTWVILTVLQSCAHDNRGKCSSMVLGPRRSQRGPGTVEHFNRSGPHHGRSLGLYRFRVIGADLPTTFFGDFRQHLAVHDRVGPTLVRRSALSGDVLRKVRRPSANGNGRDRRRLRIGELVHRHESHLRHRSTDVRDQLRKTCVIERLP